MVHLVQIWPSSASKSKFQECRDPHWGVTILWAPLGQARPHRNRWLRLHFSWASLWRRANRGGEFRERVKSPSPIHALIHTKSTPHQSKKQLYYYYYHIPEASQFYTENSNKFVRMRTDINFDNFSPHKMMDWWLEFVASTH